MILAIETTGPRASVCVLCGTKKTIKFNSNEYSHLEELAPMISGILSETGLEGKDLDAVAVSRGPGSFTGVRIGVVTAKAIAQVWDKAIALVPTLDGFCFGENGAYAGERVICPLFDARRSQAYAGAFKRTEAFPEILVKEGAYDIDNFLGMLRKNLGEKDRVLFFGDGIRVFREKLENSGLNCDFADDEHLYQKADSAAEYAALMIKSGIELSDCYRAEPEYLRLAEAERKLKENANK